jgi:SNF2 family DNA or RNA helicase
MTKLNYLKDCLQIRCLGPESDIVPCEEWILSPANIELVNVVNDLVTNGVAEIKDDEIVIVRYEDISRLDDFEYQTLQLPEKYPFDIYIDAIGSGLKDLNLEISYSFQDYSHGNGSGNLLFLKKHRKGAFLKKESEYLLSSNQYILLEKIDQFNSQSFTDTKEILKEVARIQEIAKNCQVSLSTILKNTNLVNPKRISIDLEPKGNDKYSIKPKIEGIDNELFQKRFDQFSTIRDEYHFTSDDKKSRIIIDEPDDDTRGLKTELLKLKNKQVYTSEEVNKIFDSTTRFWDNDFIDSEEFGKRVIELGIYKPKFYPFISPYKSQWIPGIVIDDKIEGKRHIKILNEDDLEDLKAQFEDSKQKGLDYVEFKGEKIEVNSIDSIIKNATKQLANPKQPVQTFDKESDPAKEASKVLIINENTESLGYDEEARTDIDIKYKFEKIDNLADGIELKNHQKEGIAWLQTLSELPYNLPGLLLADDMGLGKTIQVLYFIEWYVQKGNERPILVVAPVSLLENWQNEYLKFFPEGNLSIETLWGNNVSKYIIPNDKSATIKNLSQKALFLTTYETLRTQQIPLGLIEWGVIILDEAQKIKTPGTFVTNAAKAMKANFRIGMTGTPVENSLMDLWCIFDFCSPGLLGIAKEFATQFQKPLKDKNTDIQSLSEALRKKIGDHLMRRMKIDVAKDLPDIFYKKIEEEMPSVQFQIYNQELKEIERLKESNESKNPILQGIFNLRSISDHPYLKHYQIENIGSEELISVSAKLKKTVEILREIHALEEKVIVFTENRSMQRVLRKIITETFKVNPSIINGETPTSKSRNGKAKLSRQQEIDKFQAKSGFNAIVMSPIAAGFGLNITEANHIIHYTRHWNPAKEQQATDRAYRIGQQKVVNVYYPLAIVKGKEIESFDQVLDSLLCRKSHLASSTLFPTERIEIGKQELLDSMGFKKSDTSPVEVNSIESLDRLQPLFFEAAVALLIEYNRGVSAYLTPISNDKGADIVCFGDSTNSLVQVKQSKSKLGINSGQEIYYALAEYERQYDKVFKPCVITNSYFNSNARELADKNSVEMIDRTKLNSWIQDYSLTIESIDNKMLDRL